MNWLLLLCLQFAPSISQASEMAADTVSISSIGAQATSDGIQFASHVYIASGSSLTLRGPSGYITSGSSIIASSFWGSGSGLNGVGTLIATQTFSGGATFSSSFSVRSAGREIILSTGTTADNIKINSDGTVSFHPSLHNSTATTIPNTSTTNNTFGPCITASTLTLTTTGGRIELNFSGSVYGSGDAVNGAACGLNVLQDGQFIGNLSATSAIAYIELDNVGSTSYVAGIPFSYLLDAPATGTHSYCLSIALFTGNGCTLINTEDSSPFNTGNSRTLFYVKEIK